MRAAYVLAALTISASSEAADITYETRALTGTDGPLGPGLGVGVNFSNVSLPVLNGAGQTAFAGTLTGTGVLPRNDRGIWSEGGGTGLALVAREDDPAPGTAVGVLFSDAISLGPFVLDDAGQTSFYSIIKGTGVNSANDSGLWSEGGGSGLSLIAREGNPASGTDPGVNFSNFDDPFVFNGAGQTAFTATLLGAGVTSANNRGIWSEGGGAGLALVAREGDPAPDTGVNFGRFLSRTLNGAGQIAFSSSLAGSGLNFANDFGIWSEGGGSGLALVARAGDPAPDTGPGVSFRFTYIVSGFTTWVGAHTVLNDAGQIAFLAGLQGPGVTTGSDRGIWSTGGDSGLALVARKGDPAPSSDPEEAIEPTVSFSAFGPFVFNGAGQTAFHGFLTGVGVTSMDRKSLFAL